MNNLGTLYMDLNQLDRAESFTKEAWERRRKAYGPENPHTLDSLLNLASIHVYRAQFDQAEMSFNELIGVFNRVHGPRHLRTLQLRNNLASVHLRQKKFSQAEEEFIQLLAELRENPAPNWELLRAVLHSIADVTIRQSKWAEAEPRAREFHDQCQVKQPKTLEHYSAMGLLGQSLAELNRYAEAETLLKESYNGIMEKQPKNPPAVRIRRHNEAIQRLIRLYELWGRTDQVAEWNSRLISPTEATPSK